MQVLPVGRHLLLAYWLKFMENKRWNSEPGSQNSEG
jgi:hypothetical protein